MQVNFGEIYLNDKKKLFEQSHQLEMKFITLVARIHVVQMHSAKRKMALAHVNAYQTISVIHTAVVDLNAFKMMNAEVIAHV